jgi:hypothetical protein
LPHTNEELEKAGPLGEGESLILCIYPTLTISFVGVSDSVAVGLYDPSDWERTTYYHGITPDPPELLYRSELLSNPFPKPVGRHHLY